MATPNTTTERRDGYLGTTSRCRRCSGTGQARYNHLNGDTYCYACMGTGQVWRRTKAEEARYQADVVWGSKAYTDAYNLRLAARKLARKGFEAADGYVYTRGDHTAPAQEQRRVRAERAARLATMWVAAAGNGCTFTPTTN